MEVITNWDIASSMDSIKWLILEERLQRMKTHQFSYIQIAALVVEEDKDAMFSLDYHTYYRLVYVNLNPTSFCFEKYRKLGEFQEFMLGPTNFIFTCPMKDLEFTLSWLRNMCLCKICHIVTDRYCVRKNGVYCKDCYNKCCTLNGRRICRAMKRAWETPGNTFWKRRMMAEFEDMKTSTSAQP